MDAATTTFGPYELVRRLGVGGMAETFVARRRLGAGIIQTVCIKRILEHLADDAEMRSLFIDETEMTGHILQGGVTRVIDCGSVDGRLFLALELVDGLDLRQLLRGLDGTLPERLVLHLAYELGRALDYAHAVHPETGRTLGIVHRDISPSNILVSRNGELKLADFGIAKAMNNVTSAQTKSIKGKIAYMAPEYAGGGIYGPKTDLFALGVMLYECLVGQRPFDGTHELEALDRARRGDHVPLDVAVPGTCPQLCALIERLISPDPADRFASAAQMLDALPQPPAPVEAHRKIAVLVRQVLAERAAPPTDASALTGQATQVVTQGPETRPAAPLPVIYAGPDETTRTTPPRSQPAEAREAALVGPLSEATTAEPMRRKRGPARSAG